MASASALNLTPTGAHSQLLLVVLLLLLQEAGGGWCIKGEAPPNRVSSPRTLPQQQWESRKRLRQLSVAEVCLQQPRTPGQLVASLQVHGAVAGGGGGGGCRCTISTSPLWCLVAKGCTGLVLRDP